LITAAAVQSLRRSPRSATTIAAVIAIRYKDIPYTGVTVWALIAIAVKHSNIDVLRNLAIFLAFILTSIMLFKTQIKD
jgi:hypothetical protein